MNKKYLAKIIATDHEGLQLISAFCAEAKVKTADIKYLKKNKVFIMSLTRSMNEGDNTKNINSICKFDFVDKVKSKNINQEDSDNILKLIVIDYIKNNDNYEITLIFYNNAFITLFTELIEIRLEDQNEVK